MTIGQQMWPSTFVRFRFSIPLEKWDEVSNISITCYQETLDGGKRYVSIIFTWEVFTMSWYLPEDKQDFV